MGMRRKYAPGVQTRGSEVGEPGRSAGWLARAFEGVPEDEARLILDLNAARIYDFHTGALQPITNRIGPTVEKIIGGTAAGGEETARAVAERGVDGPAFGG